MRLYSTPESSDAGDPSKLAIVETLAVSAISYWIAWHWGTVQHIAIGACVAPLLLLRTAESQELAFQIGERWCQPVFDWVTKIVVPGSRREHVTLVGVMLMLTMLVPVMIIGVKILATFVAFLQSPVRTFRAIPTNWKRVTLALDSATPPEPLPGVRGLDNYRRENNAIVTLADFTAVYKELFLEGIFSHRGVWTVREAFGACFVVLFFSMIFLPALAYRYSLKASSLIYAPLLFVVEDTRKDEDNPLGRLKYHGRSPFARLLAVYSLGVIVLFLAKCYLIEHWNGFVTWWNGSPFWLTLGTLIEPRFLTWWQIAQGINAVLALGLFLYAWHAVQRIDYKLKVDLASANRMLSFLFGVRAVLTVYILFCTIYLTINGWQGFKGPPIGGGFFPKW